MFELSDSQHHREDRQTGPVPRGRGYQFPISEVGSPIHSAQNQVEGEFGWKNAEVLGMAHAIDQERKGVIMAVTDEQISVRGWLVRIATIEEEWYRDVESPEKFVHQLKESGIHADIFSFWQRLPDLTPRFSYYREDEPIAALPIQTYDYWWNKQINPKTRNLVRKAEKKGLIVKKTDFTDDFVKGMVSVFNETPVRQGRPFWHYGKDFDAVKRDFSRYLYREDLFGVYWQEELIGFMMLAYTEKYAILGQILSKVTSRDKAPNNALIAKAVEVCSVKRIPYLVYANWVEGSLGEFKRHNGFQRIDLPRYYIPLNLKGRVVLKLNLHNKPGAFLSQRTLMVLKKWRKWWYEKRSDIVQTVASRTRMGQDQRQL